MNFANNGASSSIIAGSFIQTFDALINLSLLKKTKRHFIEVPIPGSVATAGRQTFQLVCLDYDERDQIYVDRRETAQQRATAATGRNAKSLFPSYSLGADKALEPFLDAWIPVPVFRKTNEHGDGAPGFAPGPSNWARLWLHALDKPDADGNTHQLVLAFDATVEESDGGQTTAALTPKDVSEGGDYLLVSDERECDWFLDSRWVGEWIEAIFKAYRTRQKGRPLGDEDWENYLEHLARYITLLQALEDSGVIPHFRLVNPAQYQPVDVDLVLDIGNARTCGMLIETHADSATDLNNSFVLELRDLTKPHQRYAHPFSSRIEFAVPRFGSDALSRESGRSTQAFSWPSVVRVGPEALRLSAGAKRAEGATGMSSPKRYLWDEYPRSQEWRFNSISAEDGTSEPPVARGAFVQFINDQGTPIELLNDHRLGRHKRNSPYFGQTDDPVTSSKFSRSSLMMFMLSEIIAQALLSINSPSVRATRKNPDIPRRLRCLILTMPTAMPLAERNIFRRMAEWAVNTTWRALGWEAHIQDRASARQSKELRLNPKVRCDWDEASATQLVFLYNEVVTRFQGDIGFAFQLLGRKREGYGERENLRLASIDIGGGTTDLIITTYSAVGDRAAAVIRPTQEFREGFNTAGDDILRAVIENHVLPVFKDALRQAGVADPKSVLTELLGGDFGNQAESRKLLRAQFAVQILAPVGLKLLALYEKSDPRGARLESVPFASCFPEGGQPAQSIVDFFDQPVRRNGGGSFSLRDLVFAVDLLDVERTVHTVMGDTLADLCEIIHLYRCDVLVLTGRTSCLPAVTDIVRGCIALPPHRVISMHHYRVGRWYPFRSTHAYIQDPKTTAAVGAMLCTLAEGKLEGFAFQGDSLKTKSTARFFGDVESSGRITERHVLFGPLDLDAADEMDVERQFEFYTKTFIGFRQLEAERWPVTPLYCLDFADAVAANNARGRTPYKLTLAFTREQAREDGAPSQGNAPKLDRAEGTFLTRGGEMSDGSPFRDSDLTLRLQTMRDSQGYWLDTGIFTVL